MKYSQFFAALVAAMALALLGPPSPGLAAADPAVAGAGWQAAVERIAAAAAAPPPSVRLRSLTVAEIRERGALVRWPLSDHLERAIRDTLAARRPSFTVLGDSDGGPLPGAGRDAVLTGTFALQGEGGIQVDLHVRDLESRSTLFSLAPITLAQADLPARSAPDAGFGKLVLDVEPAGAMVYIDGEAVGRGSIAMSVPLGFHTVTVAAEGYEVFDETVSIGAGAPAHKALTVRLKRPNLLFTVDSDIPGASVKLDGQDRGTTPLSLSGLAPGKHRLVLAKEGYKTFEADMEWTGSKPGSFKAFLVPLPGSLLVTSDVGDARVEVDGADAGRAPVLLPELSPGPHKLRVVSGSRSPFEQTVEIRTSRTTHVRAKLAPDAGRDQGAAEGLAIVPRTHRPEDVALAAKVQTLLQERHPALSQIDPAESRHQALALFPEDGIATDPDLVRKFAQAIGAREVAVVGVLETRAFQRLAGVVPIRPEIRGEVGRFQAVGPRSGQFTRVTHEGGEPWLGSDRVPERPELTTALASRIADTLAGAPGGPLPGERGAPLLNTLSVLLGDTRPSPGYGLVAGGLLYERRVLDWLDLGAGYAYGNALGNDFKKGASVQFSGAGNDLVYGIGQNHTLRLDALARFDGPAPHAGPWYEGPHWTPYIGAGFRLNVPSYYVYGVNRKEAEGSYLSWEPKGSVVGGAKAFVGGAVLRLEVELPVVVMKGDPGIPLVQVGGGWMF